MSHSQLTPQQQLDYKRLSEWAETDEAAAAFTAAKEIADDDPTFLRVQAAARHELRTLRRK